MARTKRTAREGMVPQGKPAVFPRTVSSQTMAKTPLGSGRVAQKEPKSHQKALTKPRKWRPGLKALREIRKYQKSTGYLISKAPFHRLIREITHELSPGLRYQSAALEALQEAVEVYAICLLSDAQIAAIHARRITVMPRDLHLVRRLRGENEIPQHVRNSWKAQS